MIFLRQVKLFRYFRHTTDCSTVSSTVHQTEGRTALKNSSPQDPNHEGPEYASPSRSCLLTVATVQTHSSRCRPVPPCAIWASKVLLARICTAAFFTPTLLPVINLVRVHGCDFLQFAPGWVRGSALPGRVCSRLFGFPPSYGSDFRVMEEIPPPPHRAPVHAHVS